MDLTSKDYSEIAGWGIDSDPKNDPTYPIKHRENKHDDNWTRPAQQPVDIEVLRSKERANITAVFGTSTPPAWLSGILRRYAFKYSESNYGHWLPLMLADRINVLEGIIDDIRHGRFPNFLRERGWNAEWKFNRRKLLLRIMVQVIILMVIVIMLDAMT